MPQHKVVSPLASPNSRPANYQDNFVVWILGERPFYTKIVLKFDRSIWQNRQVVERRVQPQDKVSQRFTGSGRRGTMSDRIVYISPYQLGALDALDKVVNLPPLLVDRNPINVDAVVFGSMIQCGVDKFEMPQGVRNQQVKPEFSESKFLKTKITLLSDRKRAKSSETVRNAFMKFLPKDYEDKPEFSDARQLEQFITDLVISAEFRRSYMTLFPVPKISNLQNQLPPEILFPVKNLLNSFEPLIPNLPFPKLSAQSAHIKRFEQILASDLFSHYVSQHEQLERSFISRKNALKSVVEGGKNLLQKNLDFLQLRRVTISVLPITAKLVDVVFGKLPGTLADYSANLMTGLLKDEKRIVVYQLNSIFEDLIKTYVSPHIEPE